MGASVERTAKANQANSSIVVSAAFAAAMFTGACGQKAGNDSNLFHDVDDPTLSTLSHQWGEVTGEDYLKFVAPLIQLDDEFLPANNPLTKRVQTWIDRLDENLRSKHPDQMTGVPKPKARIILNPSLNAFIAPVPVCHDVEVRFKGRSGKPMTDGIFLDISGGAFDVWPSDEIKCMPAAKGQAGRDEIAAAIREFNERAPNGCKISLEKDGAKHFIAPNSSCEESSEMENFGGSETLVLLRTADWVNVYAGLITEMSEREVVGVLAHELGHYYRSHVNAPRSMYDYFYRAEENVAPSRPKAVSNLASLGNQAVQSSELLGSMDRFKRVPHQKIHSALFMATGELARGICDKDSDLYNPKACTKPCSDLSEATDKKEFKQSVLLFPLRELNADGLKNYGEFESLAIQCLAEIPLKKSQDSESADGITWDDFLDTVGAPSWPGWIEDKPEIRVAMTTWMRDIIKRLPEKAPKGANDLAVLMKKVSTYLWDKEIDATKAIQQAYDQRVGFYTNEQEADELGAEWMTELGLNPKSAVETYLRIGKWAEGEGSKASASLMETPADQCQTLYENEWRDSDGKFKFIAIGDFTDSHHHTCYRAFNVDREIRAHKLKASGDGNRGLLPASEWSDLQKIAEESTSDLGKGNADADLLSDRHLAREIKRAASHTSHFVHSGCAFSPF